MIKYMDIKEFRKEGYLQESNRKFFHPLGLALEIVIDDDGKESLGGIWDYRDDPEGMLFAPGVICKEKADRIQKLRNKKTDARGRIIGGSIQTPWN